MKYHLTAAGWVWLAWIFFGAGYELLWVFTNVYNTLSDQVWALERINMGNPLYFSDWTWLHWTIAITLWAFFAWLSVHFPFGYLR